MVHNSVFPVNHPRRIEHVVIPGTIESHYPIDKGGAASAIEEKAEWKSRGSRLTCWYNPNSTI